MIWLTWRQFRSQAVTAVAALAAFTILLAATEPHLISMYDSSGLSTCHGATCAALASQFLNQLSSGSGFLVIPAAGAYVILYFLSILAILIAPAITGVFWGAPLIARELEAGTFRLTWNQSITRTRWLTVKLTLIGAASMAVAEAFSLIQVWWAAPISNAVGLGGSASIFSEGRFGWFVFPTHGITPLGYAAFSFVLGVTAGLIARRPVPAMASTLAIFAAAQLITPLWIRPNLLPTSRTVVTIAAARANVVARPGVRMTVTASAVPGQPGAWIMSSGIVSPAGQSVSTVPAVCDSAIPRPGGAGPAAVIRGRSHALANCLAGHGMRVTESYQPASHYWPLQWAETGMYLALALALAGYCFRQLRRRLS